MAEGTAFFANEPILRVTAPMPQAQYVKSRLINVLPLQSLVAAKAARMRLVALHRDFDRLNVVHRRSRFPGSTSNSMLRAILGFLLMNPAR